MNCKNPSYCDFDVFEEKVLNNLLKNNIDLSLENSPRLGVAVSGGADSVSLLLSLSALCKHFGKSLRVITVNHRIRSDEESGGDVEFVRELCEKLCGEGIDIELYTSVLGEGEVASLSKVRKCGTEEAARFLRYRAFDDFKKQFSLDFICLAHNENDNLETILMHFLQGTGLAGIKELRDFYVRPLLNISRFEIEEYLTEKKQVWRTDKTNFDENYLRNRIRNSLVPLLNEKFPGWTKSVLGGCEKVCLDEQFFNDEIQKVQSVEKLEKSIRFERKSLVQVKKAVLYRLIFSSFSEIGVASRIPFRNISDFIDRLYIDEKYSLSMSDVELSFDEKWVLIKKPEKIATDSVFFAIIERKGRFEFPFGFLNVKAMENGSFILDFGSVRLENVLLPVAVRSRAPLDRVKTSDGRYKSVNDVLSGWHVQNDEKNLIPLVQDLTDKEQEIIAVLGCVRNYKNWIVRGLE